MIAAFLSRFGLAMLAAAMLYGGVGYATQRLMFSPPPERFYLRGVSFAVPDGWSCRMEETEVVCQPGAPPTNAIIVGTAKTASAEDTLEAYRAHLSKPQAALLSDAAAEALGVRDAIYDGHVWVDGVQRHSEIENYETRYLATVFGASAVLITLSCHRDHCGGYREVTEAFAASVKGSGAR